MTENLLANRHGKVSKIKYRRLLKIKIFAETDNDASKFPKTVLEILQKNSKTQPFSRTAKMLLSSKGTTSRIG